MFNLAQYIIDRGVEHVTSGSNVRQGNISIKCPWCGDADPSQHMGIHLKTGAWSCWRSSAHRGRRPQRLLVALFGMTWAEAIELTTDTGIRTSSLGALREQVERLTNNPQAIVSDIHPIKMPDSFRPMTASNPFAERYRSFFCHKYRTSPISILEIVTRYDLHYCMTGPFAHRLIVPVKYRKKLVGWTGRAVNSDAHVRYLSHPPTIGNEISPLKRVLFNVDKAASGGRLLVICEGPMDAIKVDFAGWPYGVRAVGGLGATLTEEQCGQIALLSKRFDDCAIMLDNDPTGLRESIAMRKRLSFCEPYSIRLPREYKDPGDVPLGRLEKILYEFLQ